MSRLKGEVETAIKSIQAYQGPAQEVAHEILAKQLKKIKSLDNITSVAEGFVFEYDGQLYKFTGNFAPINQILGLFRFGRGGVKIPKVNEAKGATETVAIVPGAFKPPHRGHLDMVKHYSDNADRVIVMVSPKARQTPSGQDVGQEQSIAIWELYLNKSGLTNVEVIPSPHPSPIRSAYEYVETTAQPGENVILGTSTKGGDQSRFAKNVQAYAKEGVRILDPMKFAFNPVGEEISASDFRSSAESGDISRFLPSGVEPQDVLDILGIQGEAEEANEHVALPIFFRLIEEVMEEIDFQKDSSRIKKHSNMRMSTKGTRKPGGAPYDVSPPKARAKSAPPGFGGALEESERFSEGIQEETWYHGTDSPLEGDIKPLYLTPSKNLADMLGKEVYAFKIKPKAKWFDMGSKETGPYLFSMDTIGYLPDKWEDFTSYGVDVVCDVPDFRKGFEQIFVVDTEVLEMVENDIEEMSSMGGGSVAGYSLPLGAKPQRPKNKKNKKKDDGKAIN